MFPPFPSGAGSNFPPYPTHNIGNFPPYPPSTATGSGNSAYPPYIPTGYPQPGTGYNTNYVIIFFFSLLGSSIETII